MTRRATFWITSVLALEFWISPLQASVAMGAETDPAAHDPQAVSIPRTLGKNSLCMSALLQSHFYSRSGGPDEVQPFDRAQEALKRFRTGSLNPFPQSRLGANPLRRLPKASVLDSLTVNKSREQDLLAHVEELMGASRSNGIAFVLRGQNSIDAYLRETLQTQTSFERAYRPNGGKIISWGVGHFYLLQALILGAPGVAHGDFSVLPDPLTVALCIIWFNTDGLWALPSKYSQKVSAFYQNLDLQRQRELAKGVDRDFWAHLHLETQVPTALLDSAWNSGSLLSAEDREEQLKKASSIEHVGPLSKPFASAMWKILAWALGAKEPLSQVKTPLRFDQFYFYDSFADEPVLVTFFRKGPRPPRPKAKKQGQERESFSFGGATEGAP